jgi:hypothetical protein
MFKLSDMKKIVAFASGAVIICVSSVVFAQEVKTKRDTGSIGQDLKKVTKLTGKAISKGAKKVGKGAAAVAKKTAEVSSKGYAEVKDKSLINIKGPSGETVYVNKYNQKYYVNKKGRWVYLEN